MKTSIATWTMERMQLDLIFGVGAFFLYILVPVALLANEVRLAKRSDDTSGTSAILDAMAQAGFFIVAWLLFVTVFTYLLVGVVGDIHRNPVVGILDFWQVDWLNAGVIDSLKNGTIFTENGQAGLEQARSIAFFLSVAKMLEILLLLVMLFLTINISMWLPLYKMRRTSHSQMASEIDIAAAISFLMMFVTGMILFNFLLGIENILLNSVFAFANKIHGNIFNIQFDGKPLNILNDVWILLNNAVTEFDK